MFIGDFPRIKDSVYIDDGISGTRFDRPGFMAMMDEIESGNVATVLVKDMSRVGRDYLKDGLYMETMRELGVHLIGVTDNADNFNDDEFMPFRNILNEYYARGTSKKIRVTFQAKGKAGKHVASGRMGRGTSAVRTDVLLDLWVEDVCPSYHQRRPQALFLLRRLLQAACRKPLPV